MSVAPDLEIENDNILVAKGIQYGHINHVSNAGNVMIEEDIDTDQDFTRYKSELINFIIGNEMDVGFK